MTIFQSNEKYLSQIPAIQLLINLGYDYLSPSEALALRGGKLSNVVLDTVLNNQLRKINSIQHKGETYRFSEENIQTAVDRLKSAQYDGLLRTNEVIYDMLTLPQAMEQTINGDTKSFNMKYIDWEHPENNVFHVTAEYSVERTASSDTARPDIVLFVNGIPLCVIECKAPKEEVEKGIEQSIRNQSEDYIPKLFVYSQLILATNKNETKYATTYTSKNYWGVWQEKEYQEADFHEAINTKLTNGHKEKLFTGDFAECRSYFDELEQNNRMVTEQDRSLYSLCKPERLLELAYKFTLFDGGIKKIARYQQYFVIKSAIDRIKSTDQKGNRNGGMIWHTQGSGKSLTMVMMVRNIALDSKIKSPRFILVTDRKDLDHQLKNTFTNCGLTSKRANTGKNLLKLIEEKKQDVISTLIDKFGSALENTFKDESPDIFLLVDEAHRGHFGSKHSKMRKILPNACILGFTGTPLVKEDKNNFKKFGKLIDPHYSIQQAVKDGAVVPLLYEGRMVDILQNKPAMDKWFEKHTEGLSREQKADLKKKYARAGQINSADQVIYATAYDISEHYRDNWQGTPFKAQLVAPSKKAAIRYHEYLKEIGFVSSEVVISAPDDRESYEEVDEGSIDEVVQFWSKMMKRYGSEDEYLKTVTDRFLNSDDPEILIVVSKLLTGFDAPRNAVLYICKPLKDHTLLQAIARVNRLYDGKSFGYIIDYMGLLGNLDQALTMYSEAGLADYDEEDLAGTLTSIMEEIDKLPQKHAHLLDVFAPVKNKMDEEEYEELLRDDELRDEFYDRLSEFARSLGIALSSEKFLEDTDYSKIKMYKDDLKRLKKLRDAVRLRYAESIDYKQFEAKIEKLIHTHIYTGDVEVLNKPVNIFDDKEYEDLKESKGITDSAKADAIAHKIKKVAKDKYDEDPAFYEKFSKMVQDAIDKYKEGIYKGLEYLNKINEIRDKFIKKVIDGVPKKLEGNDIAITFYGNLKKPMTVTGVDEEKLDDIISDMALELIEIFERNRKIMFWEDKEAQKAVMNEIDDYLYDVVKAERGLDLSLEQMDEVIEVAMKLAEFRIR